MSEDYSINEPTARGLDKTSFDAEITENPNEKPNLLEVIETLMSVLKEIIDSRSFNGSYLAELSSQITQARISVEEEKKNLITNVSNQSGSKLSRLQIKSQELAVEREFLNTFSDMLKKMQENMSNASKNVGVEGTQQLVEIYGSLTKTLDEMRRLVNRR